MSILNKKIKYLVFFSVLIILLSLFLKKEYVLVIQDRNNSKKIEFSLESKKFVLGYVHSVMKTPVEEHFRVDDKCNITLEKTIYKSYGVGLPFLPEEGTFYLEDGKFILIIERTFPKINMSISPIASHYLQIGNKKYYMTELLGNKNSKILIEIKKKSIGGTKWQMIQNFMTKRIRLSMERFRILT